MAIREVSIDNCRAMYGNTAKKLTRAAEAGSKGRAADLDGSRASREPSTQIPKQPCDRQPGESMVV